MRLNGSLTLQIAELYERGVKLVISDAGLCGSTPHTLTVMLHWKGKREAIKELEVKTMEQHVWTVADRVAHRQKLYRANRTQELSVCPGLRRLHD